MTPILSWWAVADFFPRSELKVFITGGNSGLGKALAEAYYRKGSQVIISGRNEQALQEVADQCPGLTIRVLDLADRDAIADCGVWLREHHPDLDVLINNAGIQKIVKFHERLDTTDLTSEIEVNLTALVLLTNEVLPILLKRPQGALINVSSALAFVPLAATPIYCATKAAVHSLSVSLRRQLARTGVRVIEVIPPKVATNLHRHQEVDLPDGLSVDAFLRQTLIGLSQGRDEIFIEKSRVLYWASRIAPNWILNILNSRDPR
jgi:uncharacterized oxidoreductase